PRRNILLPQVVFPTFYGSITPAQVARMQVCSQMIIVQHSVYRLRLRKRDVGELKDHRILRQRGLDSFYKVGVAVVLRFKVPVIRNKSRRGLVDYAQEQQRRQK